jgi:hypothetical protein
MAEIGDESNTGAFKATAEIFNGNGLREEAVGPSHVMNLSGM